MMHRNLDRRVEVLVRLPTEQSRAEVERLLDLAFDPATDAWELDADGTWQRRRGEVHLQEVLITTHRRRRKTDHGATYG